MTEQIWFNLNISGLGYVNRIREVKPKKGQAFLCCDIAALRGASDDVDYQRFDCIVTGKDAQQLIRRCMQACQQKRKVLIQFRLGDLYTDTFVYSQGKRQGQTGVSLKAHLLFIGMIKVEGEVVYQAKQRNTAEAEGIEHSVSHASPAAQPATDANSSPVNTPITKTENVSAEANEAELLPAKATVKNQPEAASAELAYF